MWSISQELYNISRTVATRGLRALRVVDTFLFYPKLGGELYEFHELRGTKFIVEMPLVVK